MKPQYRHCRNPQRHCPRETSYVEPGEQKRSGRECDRKRRAGNDQWLSPVTGDLLNRSCQTAYGLDMATYGEQRYHSSGSVCGRPKHLEQYVLSADKRGGKGQRDDHGYARREPVKWAARGQVIARYCGRQGRHDVGEGEPDELNNARELARDGVQSSGGSPCSARIPGVEYERRHIA